MKPSIRNIILPVAALAVGLGIAGGVAVHAANNPTAMDSVNSLVDSIATKFNLNRTDVQQVFDEHKTQMQSQRDEFYKNKLTEAVTANKLTQEQADKIIAKRAEIKAQFEVNRDNLETQTLAEHRAFMDKLKADLKQWEKDNNIPSGYLNPDFAREMGREMGRGKGVGMGRDMMDNHMGPRDGSGIN